jgi:hypothetical protein
MPEANQPTRTDNDVVAELAQKAGGKAEVIFVTVPNGTGVVSVPLLVRPIGNGQIAVESLRSRIDEWRTAPERKRGTAHLVDLDSFIAHVERNKDAHSALFALPDENHPTLTAVFNYNEENTLTYDASKPDGARTSRLEGGPRFGDHRAVYDFPVSEEWEAWHENDGQAMTQEVFAVFLEDRLVDVADPRSAMESALQFAEKLGVSFATPQKLLELSRGLSIRIGQKVRQNVKLQSGEGQMQFSEEHTDEAGAPISIPGAFLIQVPVFKSGAQYQIPVRLRYRVQGGSVSWSFDLYRADRVFDHAFDEACTTANENTELPLFRGSPEQ